METYFVKVKCPNCGATETVEIPKGQTISDFLALRYYDDLAFRYCDNCGCPSLVKGGLKPGREK